MIKNYLRLSKILVCLFLLSSGVLSAQMPDQMRISEDGRRLTLGGNASEGFYDESIVRTIDLQFENNDFWEELDPPGGGGGPMNTTPNPDILATMIVEGETYDSVAVRIKGQTSDFQNNSEKKSFNVTVDYTIGGQDVMGYETLNLNCGYLDESAVREVLYNYIGRQYNPSLQANFVEVHLNGENWGPYTNVQQLNAEFLKEWFWNNNGTRWRALRTTGGGPGGPGGMFGTGVSTLNYLGDNVGEYEDAYTLKSTQKENPWEDLIRVCDKLNNLPSDQLADSLRHYMDVDKVLWFLAHEIIFADDDSYVHKGGMDYYVYWDEETNLIIPLEYDGNTVMQEQGWSPFYNQNDADYPLMNRLFAVPELRQRYLAHMRTILDKYMVSEQLNAKIDEYAALIDGLIADDPKAIYSYNQYLNGVQEVKDFITERRNFLLNAPEVNVEGLDISGVIHTVNGEELGTVLPDDEVMITANVSGTMGVDKVVLYYAPGFVGVFDETEMYDDGAHGDGAAGDGIYGGTVPAFEASSYVRYYVEAIANNSAKTATYMPKRAEQDVYIYQVGIQEAAERPIVINEIMASNDASIADEAGEFDDWIELYNVSDAPVDLGGYFITDNINNLRKFEFAEGTIINPDEYLIVWADEDGSQGDLHANFKLSSSGESVLLLNPDIEWMDRVDFTELESDKGYARVPNGTGDFVLQDHTFGANNAPTTSLSEANRAPIELYPNPTNTNITIDLGINEIKLITIVDIQGKVIWEKNIYEQTQVDVSEWSAGVYYVKMEEGVKRFIALP